MAELTDNPKDPRLTHGADETPAPQAAVYLVLSEEERAKGFVRPYRDRYIHIGNAPKHPLRDLTPEEIEQYSKFGYVAFEQYPEGHESGSTGMYWTRAQLDAKGCGVETIMGTALSETYARKPDFYGATYCIGCQMHRPVAEFRWSADGQIVGS